MGGNYLQKKTGRDNVSNSNSTWSIRSSNLALTTSSLSGTGGGIASCGLLGREIQAAAASHA